MMVPGDNNNPALPGTGGEMRELADGYEAPPAADENRVFPLALDYDQTDTNRTPPPALPDQRRVNPAQNADKNPQPTPADDPAALDHAGENTAEQPPGNDNPPPPEMATTKSDIAFSPVEVEDAAVAEICLRFAADPDWLIVSMLGLGGTGKSFIVNRLSKTMFENYAISNVDGVSFNFKDEELERTQKICIYRFKPTPRQDEVAGKGFLILDLPGERFEEFQKGMNSGGANGVRRWEEGGSDREKATATILALTDAMIFVLPALQYLDPVAYRTAGNIEGVGVKARMDRTNELKDFVAALDAFRNLTLPLRRAVARSKSRRFLPSRPQAVAPATRVEQSPTNGPAQNAPAPTDDRAIRLNAAMAALFAAKGIPDQKGLLDLPALVLLSRADQYAAVLAGQVALSRANILESAASYLGNAANLAVRGDVAAAALELKEAAQRAAAAELKRQQQAASADAAEVAAQTAARDYDDAQALAAALAHEGIATPEECAAAREKLAEAKDAADLAEAYAQDKRAPGQAARQAFNDLDQALSKAMQIAAGLNPDMLVAFHKKLADSAEVTRAAAEFDRDPVAHIIQKEKTVLIKRISTQFRYFKWDFVTASKDSPFRKFLNDGEHYGVRDLATDWLERIILESQKPWWKRLFAATPAAALRAREAIDPEFRKALGR